MKDNLLTQAIYRTVFCTVSTLACLLSFGFFSVGGNNEFTFSTTFWKFYTNLSNYVCLFVGFMVLHNTILQLRGGATHGHNTWFPTFKFMATVLILVTFLVYAVLLGNPFSLRFWNDLGNLSYHVIAPVLFILDWFLFDRHRSLKVTDPLKTLILPLIYVFYTLILGLAIPDYEYPYFFLDVNTLGYGGVAVWVVILLAVFIVLSYLMWVYDKLVKVDGKWKLDFSPLQK